MGTEVRVRTLPTCQTHEQVFPGEVAPKAAVDGATIYGPWANMCDGCHGSIGVGLGTGRGQRLLLEEKRKRIDGSPVSRETQLDALNRAMVSICGLGISDLPDRDWDAYLDADPHAAARAILAEEGFEG